MKKLIIVFCLLSGFLHGQTTVTLPPLRGGSLSTFNNSAMISDYAFIETSGVAGFYKLMSGDVTTPASDSVVVKADNTRWKLLSNLSPTAVTWGSVTGKPTIYSSPAALKTALETLTGSARLDTSAIKNLSGITTESDPNVGSHIKAITTDDITAWNAKYGTGAAVVSALSGLSGTNRLPWSALKDVPAETDPNVGSHIKAITTTNITDWTNSYRTGASVVSSLSALSGSARLPASAIKDLPTVTDNSSIQKIETRVGGTLIGTRKSINLIAGSNVTVTGSDNSGSDRVDITLSATGGGGTGMAEPSSNGLAVRTSSGASAARSIVAPAAGITITNGDGVSGNPTLVLADDLAGIEGLSTTGYVKRTGTGTFSAGTAIDLSGSEVTGTIAAGRMPALTGDIVTTAGAVATTYNNVVPSSKGGAGSVNGLMKANGSGTVSAATAGTDYVVPSGSITGSAATLTTPRAIYGNNFDGSAAITSAIGLAYGGSGQTTAQLAMNAFAGAVTNALFLRGNGTNVVMGAIQASDLPTAIDATKLADGTITSTELQYINTLSSNAQTQIDAKAPIASPTLTGTPLAPTATSGTNTTQIATTAFVTTAAAVKQPNVQYQKDASNKGSSGGISTINYVGNGVKIVNSSGTNTITIQKDYVTLEEFGGAADGTTDNYAAFNSAKAIGKKILLAPGTYATSAPWLINADAFELVGSGKFVTKIIPLASFNNTNDSSLVRIGSSVYRPANITIRDLWISANVGTDGLDISGLLVDADFNIDIINCWFQGGDYNTRPAAAVRVNRSKHLRFTTCNFTNSTSYGVLVSGLAYDDTNFIDCQFDENQADIVVNNVGYVQRMFVTNCAFGQSYDNTGYPAPVKYVNIKNTHASTIDHIEITNCSFFNNNTTSPTLTAIDLLTPITATIRNSSFYNLKKYAIVSRYGGKIYVQNNRFLNSGRSRTDNDPEDGTNDPDASTYTSDIFFYTGFFGGAITDNVSDNASMGWVESNLSDVQYLYTKIENNRIYAHKRYYGLVESATAAPTDTNKNYLKGEYVVNSNPSELGTTPNKYIIKGWVCITAGYPGTWVQDRALTGN